MKLTKAISIVAATAALALAGCQQSSQQVVGFDTTPVGTTTKSGSCVFDSKSGKTTVNTSKDDCAARGGMFAG